MIYSLLQACHQHMSYVAREWANKVLFVVEAMQSAISRRNHIFGRSSLLFLCNVFQPVTNHHCFSASKFKEEVGTEQSRKCRLPGPLTPAKRAREAQLGGASQAGSSLASPSQRLKTEPTSGASTAAATGAGAAAGSMPGDDLPPVIAPPGRSAALTLRLLPCRVMAEHKTHCECTLKSMPTSKAEFLCCCRNCMHAASWHVVILAAVL